MKVKIGVLGVVAALMCGAGVALAVSESGRQTPVPVGDDVPLKIDYSPPGLVAKQISRLSILDSPTNENLARLTNYELDRVRYGLEQTGGKNSSGLSAVGLVTTDLGSRVLVFTTSDQVCFFSAKSNGSSLGGCSNLDSTSSRGTYAAGEHDANGDFYIVGLAPDDVEYVTADPQSAGRIGHYENVYEAVVSPENVEIVGKSKSGQTVMRIDVPVEVFAGG